MSGIFTDTCGSPFCPIASVNACPTVAPCCRNLYVPSSLYIAHSYFSLPPWGSLASTLAVTVSPALTSLVPLRVSLLITGQRYLGVLPVQSACIVSAAASLLPSGRNMPYHVAVASTLLPQ